MKICGPKLSLCGILLSIWGVIQLSLMGLFYHMKCIAFVDDLDLDHSGFESVAELYEKADTAYETCAHTCFYATGIYSLILLFSIYQYYLNRRASLKVK
ncbi:ribonuclease kappa-B-like [Chrysoperla carnea]|uniref:ribonuclease kappa-B-like n=1 Tax=Chrysoperla carnea TaxID=189513 RepID=UPI001D08190A|nr:ribonuclease kappa-B-like [Chrysoperla carnea]